MKFYCFVLTSGTAPPIEKKKNRFEILTTAGPTGRTQVENRVRGDDRRMPSAAEPARV